MSCFRDETSPTQFRTKAGFMGLPDCMPADDESRTDVIDILHVQRACTALRMHYMEQKCACTALRMHYTEQKCTKRSTRA